MNDPNATDDGLPEDLEAEYLEAAEKGDFKAIDYALAESEDFGRCVQGLVMSLMQVTGIGPCPLSAAMWAKLAREEILGVIREHVAPLWAAQELPKRVAATEDMVAEWEAA